MTKSYLKIELADGTFKYSKLPEGFKSVKICTKKVRPSFRPRATDGDLWKGLWITDTAVFIEVVTVSESYFLNSRGGRMIYCSIDRVDGAVYIGGVYSCKLSQRKRGDEYFVKGREGRLAWPILKGSRQ